MDLISPSFWGQHIFEMDRHGSIYIVWKKYQRRVESLAPEMGASINYYHYGWEERRRVFKAFSYVLKFTRTLADLLRQRPRRVFVQLAPTPALYAVAAYAWLSGSAYVADCHNSMIYGTWIDWPLARRLLNRSESILVHNADVAEKAARRGLATFVLRTPLPRISIRDSKAILTRLGLKKNGYVIVPGNLADDEPLEEIFDAARLIPEVPFVFTWFAERLPQKLRATAPSNVVFTGYLAPDAFNVAFAHAAAALVLTRREGTQPSGAAEAVALEVPVVLSDLNTTRRINGRAAIYVFHDPPTIAAGVRLAIREQDVLRQNMRALKHTLVGEMGRQILALKSHLGMPSEISYLDHLLETPTPDRPAILSPA